MTAATTPGSVVYEDAAPTGFNPAFDALRHDPGRLTLLLDRTHPDQLPEDLTPWTRTGVRREDVVAVLREHGGGDPDVLDRLAAPGATVVVTGQQPAVGGGPLYTLYKVATAIRQAEVLEQRHGTPVIPVFWNASDDHDWDEANRFTRWKDGEWSRSVLPEELPGAHLYDKQLPPLENLARQLGVETDVLAGCEDDSLPGWTARLLRRAFPDAPLVIAEPRRFRHLAVDFNTWLFDRVDTVDQELLMAGSALELRGVDRTFREGDGAPLCVEINGRRQRLRLEDGVWRGRHDAFGDADAVRRSLRDEPSRWSPNVVGRPLWVRTLLPVVAEVVGPAEALYQLQLQGLFRQAGLDAPVLVPRMTATVLRARDVRKWEKLDVPLSALATDEAIRIDPGTEAVVTERLAGIGQLLDRVREASVSGYPEAESKIDKAVTRLKRDLGRLPGLLERAERSRRADDVARREGLRAFTHPGGRPQERVASLSACEALFGPGWWSRIGPVVDPLKRQHAWILMGDDE